jgi:hypothetical protein
MDSETLNDIGRDTQKHCRYASESTGTNITCSGTYAVLILDGCFFLLEVA